MRSNEHHVSGFARIFDKEIPREPITHILEKEKPYLTNPSLTRFPWYDSYWDIKLYVPANLISLADRMYLLDE